MLQNGGKTSSQLGSDKRSCKYGNNSVNMQKMQGGCVY